MKRKVALVLAAVLGISALTPTTVFAATDNYVDNRSNVSSNTAFFESGILSPSTIANTAGHKANSDEAEWYVEGTDLVAPLLERARDGDTFRLTLNNAKWNFRVADGNLPIADVRTTYEALGIIGAAPSPSNPRVTDPIINTINAPLANKNFSGLSVSTGSTYNTHLGVYFPRNDDYGTYYRAGGRVTRASGSTVYHEVSYRLDVSALNNSVATITVLGSNGGTGEYANSIGNTYEFRIPLVCRTTTDDNVEVTVEVDGGNRSTVTNQKIQFSNINKGKTKTTAKSVTVSRDTFNLEDIIIAESRPATIQAGEIIKLSLPYGYHFDISNIEVGVEPGLAWDNTNRTGYGTRGGWVTGTSFTGDYAVGFKNTSNYTDKLQVTTPNNYSDDSEIWIELGPNFANSTQLRGNLYIHGLIMWADDNAPMPTDNKSIDIKMHVNGKNNITEEDVVIAQRVDWAVSLKTTNTIPTLVSGRYIGPSWEGTDADDNTHKTARVQLYESTSNAWWATRTTVLALPATNNNDVKGAKFRKVQVKDTSNLESAVADDLKNVAHGSSMYGLSGSQIGSGIYLNDNERHGYITVNDNKITLSNIRIQTNKKASIDFDLWVSIELGFGKQTGDLNLTIDPSTNSLTGTQNVAPSTVIAHVVDPISVTTKVSDLKIGYQYQPTADIQISENGSGYLLKNKTVRVSITDLISSDMWFTPDTKIQVTSGDLKIKNISTTGIGGFTSQSYSVLSNIRDTSETASIAFDIDRESTAASTITISNVAVKLDRTVPVTNRASYQAIVWGTAVAENYGLTSPSTSSYASKTWKAGFNTAGVYSPYINVISSPTDQGSILSQEVRVTIGENYYTVNGQSYSMPAAAYISPASHSTLVPLRFVANAFGLRDENQIVWDDTNKTATIFAPNRTIQFTLNKASMLVDGVSITMFSPDNLPVVAEIKGDRMYIPFRALGQAFGVPVTWDASTQTAIYNEGANTNTNASITNTNPGNLSPSPVPTLTPTP